MQKISTRAQQMPASPIRKLVPFALAAKAKGIYVHHLNIGQPDIESPQTALDALKTIPFKTLEYSLSEGNIEYREALLSYYNSLGLTDLHTSSFMVCNGGSEALQITLSVLCDSDDEIIIPEPFYANYNGFAKAIGVKVKAVTAVIDNDFALPPIAEFEKQIGPKTKAIVICNPGNPTGYMYRKDELQALADLAIKYNLTIVSDEVYREYVYDNHTHYSILNFPELKENAIVIDSESKRYSLCGVRIGFLVSRSAEFLAAAIKFAQARLSPPLIGQILATAAHQNDKAYIQAVKAEYAKRKDILIDCLSQIPGVKCSNPQGAFYCMVELPIDDSERFAQWLLSDFAYDNQTVMLAPAGGFYSKPELGKKQVRLAYVLKEDDLRASANILSLALEQYPGTIR
jgi:aspartate aminotransferase